MINDKSEISQFSVFCLMVPDLLPMIFGFFKHKTNIVENSGTEGKSMFLTYEGEVLMR